MGVGIEKEKFDERQDVSTLIIWYLDFIGEQNRWPQIRDTFCIENGEVHIVGRAVAEDSFCLIDPRISRRHASIEVTERGLRICDLGSANGTYVNGVKISEPKIVFAGDQVLFDRIPFMVRRSLNVADHQALDDHRSNKTAGLARKRLITARRQRLANEGKTSNVVEVQFHKDDELNDRALESRYSGIKPVMIGSGFALIAACCIVVFLA